MESERFEQLLERITGVKRYKRGSREAPHKPLVLLYTLASVAAGRRWITFNETEHALSPIIRRNWNAVARIEQPFVRLSNDGFWFLSHPVSGLQTPSGAISLPMVRRPDVFAGFDDATFACLRARPSRVSWAARVVLFEIASDDLQTSIMNQLKLPV